MINNWHTTSYFFPARYFKFLFEMPTDWSGQSMERDGGELSPQVINELVVGDTFKNLHQ